MDNNRQRSLSEYPSAKGTGVPDKLEQRGRKPKVGATSRIVGFMRACFHEGLAGCWFKMAVCKRRRGATFLSWWLISRKKKTQECQRCRNKPGEKSNAVAVEKRGRWSAREKKRIVRCEGGKRINANRDKKACRPYGTNPLKAGDPLEWRAWRSRGKPALAKLIQNKKEKKSTMKRAICHGLCCRG